MDDDNSYINDGHHLADFASQTSAVTTKSVWQLAKVFSEYSQEIASMQAK